MRIKKIKHKFENLKLEKSMFRLVLQNGQFQNMKSESESYLAKLSQLSGFTEDPLRAEKST